MTTYLRFLPAALVVALVLAMAPMSSASAQDRPSAPAPACIAPDQEFGPDITHVWVVVPTNADTEMQATATDIVTQVRDIYGDDRVSTTRQLQSNLIAVSTERRIVINDDIAVPSQPQWFSHDPTTVFVHWTTAIADVEALLRPDLAPQELCSTNQAPGLLASWQLADDDNAVLTGYSDSVSYDVNLPTGWALTSDAMLSTGIVASEIAQNSTSVRFDLDDHPLSTWSLSDSTDVVLKLPASEFQQGFSLEARTTTPIIEEGGCADPSHVGRWVDLGRPVIQGTIAPTDVDVARAVTGLGPVSSLTQQPLTIFIPDSQNPAILEAAGAIVAAISTHGAPLSWDVVSGGTDMIQGSGIAIEPGDEPAAISVRTIGTDVVLTLSGDEGEMVQIAQALADPSRLLFFHDDVVSIAAVPPATTETVSEVFRFEDAGYGDRTLRGAGVKSLVYRVHIPAGTPPDSATLALYATYAPALADQEATVSMRINGSEEQIVAVLDNSGQLEALHTIAPANLRPGLNYVKVTVQLGGTAAGGCSPGESRWFTVSASSALAAKQDSTPQPVRLGVEDARFALAATTDFSQADFVIVENPTDQEIAAALRVLSELAYRSQGGSPRLVTDQNADTSRHLVLIGQSGDRELLTDITDGVANSNIGVITAIPSPHSHGRVLLAFTGYSAAATEAAIDAGLSSEVNAITAPYALVSIDTILPADNADSAQAGPPAELAFEDNDDEQRPGPSADDYDNWLLEQAARIQAANAPQTDARRTVALGFLMAIGVTALLMWVRRSRRSDIGGH